MTEKKKVFVSLGSAISQELYINIAQHAANTKASELVSETRKSKIILATLIFFLFYFV